MTYAARADPAGFISFSELDVDVLYDGICHHADEAGGVPAALILDPPQPQAVMFSDEEQWFDRNDGLAPLPGRTELRGLALQQLGNVGSVRTGGSGTTPEMLTVCLEALMAYSSHERETRGFLRIMHDVLPRAPVRGTIRPDETAR